MEILRNIFLTVGLCGGFTTFSTFSKEALTRKSFTFITRVGHADNKVC